VVIGTPTDTHYDLIHGAAKNGKAIFCEKPIDMSVDRIRACIDAVDAAGVPFLTGFNRRFDPNFAALRARIAAGDIGAVELATITSRDPAPPPVSYIQRSGGLFRDMMIHDFDMARFLLGEEFVRLHAVGSALVDPEIGAAGDVDTAAVILTTASGASARSPTRAGRPMAMTRGSRFMARKGCCAPRTSWRQPWNWPPARASGGTRRSTSS
jgi:myo-inositol 2-dehydrogenase/D-chiro-inositol 1-dehydrogenase